MKRAVIVHCWGGSSHYTWYQSVQRNLEAKGYSVDIPDMPDTENPRIDTWLQCLKQVIGKTNDELILIGHSIGCATIMRYLETLEENEQVNKVIFVAGFTDQLGFRELENFFEKRLNFPLIKSKSTRGFVAIQSDNDSFVSAQYGTRLQDELDAKLIIKPGAGHMSGIVDGEESCVELSEVIENI